MTLNKKMIVLKLSLGLKKLKLNRPWMTHSGIAKLKMCSTLSIFLPVNIKPIKFVLSDKHASIVCNIVMEENGF